MCCCDLAASMMDTQAVLGHLLSGFRVGYILLDVVNLTNMYVIFIITSILAFPSGETTETTRSLSS
jgi:hypothetical protein